MDLDFGRLVISLIKSSCKYIHKGFELEKNIF